MKEKLSISYDVNLSYESVTMPPIRDIMIIGRECRQGPECMNRCIDLLEPGKFEMMVLDDPTVHAILVNKALLKRLPAEKIVDILRKQVIPYMAPKEMLRVSFGVTITVHGIKGQLEG